MPQQSRKVVGNISLSLDGQIHGRGGDYDMGWIIPHAVTETSRHHLTHVAMNATTALLGRKNYEGFGGYWPAVATDESADPHDRRLAQRALKAARPGRSFCARRAQAPTTRGTPKTMAPIRCDDWSGFPEAKRGAEAFRLRRASSTRRRSAAITKPAAMRCATQSTTLVETFVAPTSIGPTRNSTVETAVTTVKLCARAGGPLGEDRCETVPRF